MMGGPDFVSEEDEEEYADSTILGRSAGRDDGDDAVRVRVGLHSGEEGMNLGFQEFYLVWRVDGESHVPTKRHLSEQSAKAEAERLAQKHPGNEFYVMRSVAAVRVASVQWSAAIAASDMPF